jgi:hypothetical protein
MENTDNTVTAPTTQEQVQAPVEEVKAPVEQPPVEQAPVVPVVDAKK